MKTIAIALLLVSCSNPPPAKTVEKDLCLARADYKASGIAPAAPGSIRAKLEAAEDAFCATLTP